MRLKFLIRFRILHEKQSVIHVPLIGKVTAGIPITAIENIEEFFPLPETFGTADDNLFMLEIMGR